MLGVSVSQQGSGRPEDGGAGSTADEGREERSLEQSRQLILEWAGELRHIDAVRAVNNAVLINNLAKRRTTL